MRAMRGTKLVALAICLLVPLVVGGCGPEKPKAKTANVSAGAMPSGADWTGVYFSPLYGNLHMVQEGNLVNGKWQRPQKGRWGKLQGNADGDLLKFDWEEYIDGLVGPNAKKKGKGYFKYSRPEGDNVDDVIVGQVGPGTDEVGIDWQAIKQRNVKPNLKAIGGSGSGDVGGGDWDSDNTEGGTPEAPKSDDSGAPEL